jgi:hypothetical protein
VLVKMSDLFGPPVTRVGHVVVETTDHVALGIVVAGDVHTSGTRRLGGSTSDVRGTTPDHLSEVAGRRAERRVVVVVQRNLVVPDRWGRDA